MSGTVRAAQWTQFLHPSVFFAGAAVCLGLRGLILLGRPALAVDLYFHDTYAILTSVHFYFLFAAFFGIFTGVYGLLDRRTPADVSLLLGQLHFWMSFASTCLFFWVLHRLGAIRGSEAGDISLRELFLTENRKLIFGVGLFFVAQVLFFVNVVLRVVRRPTDN
jgi:heme/copper-type cytochrome/quinol oxidase subunit 1